MPFFELTVFVIVLCSTAAAVSICFVPFECSNGFYNASRLVRWIKELGSICLFKLLTKNDMITVFIRADMAIALDLKTFNSLFISISSSNFRLHTCVVQLFSFFLSFRPGFFYSVSFLVSQSFYSVSFLVRQFFYSVRIFSIPPQYFHGKTFLCVRRHKRFTPYCLLDNNSVLFSSS